VDFTRVDGQVDALQDLFALNARVEVFDFENRFAHFLNIYLTTDEHG
jgi:hypothetical protein